MTSRFHVELELPFAWQICPVPLCQSRQTTNSSVFNLLESYDFTAAAHEADHKIDRDIQRVEAKLDLVLQLLRRMLEQHQNPPPAASLRLAPLEVAWPVKVDMEMNSTVQLDIYLDPRLPQPVYLCGHVVTNEAGWVIVTLHHPDESAAEAWQRWLFRQHRHQIAKIRGQQHP